MLRQSPHRKYPIVKNTRVDYKQLTKKIKTAFYGSISLGLC